MIITKCLICKEKIKTNPSRVKEGRGKFCSRKCFGKHRKTLIGEKNFCWRGGRMQRSGYWFIYKPEHPYAKNGRYIQEHRYVMEQKLGRILKPDEIVHHINHIKTDNRPENLELLSKSRHHSHHSAGENNPMFGIIRDHGLHKLQVKIPLEVIEKYKDLDDDFVTLPFKEIQKYLGNIRKIPMNGKPYGRSWEQLR